MKKSKTKKKVGKQDPKKSEKPATRTEETAENHFDFGGLPDRDLKKNLGCG